MHLIMEYGNLLSIEKVQKLKSYKEVRQDIAKSLGAKEKEIYFTSGGTECNNTIIRGITSFK